MYEPFDFYTYQLGVSPHDPFQPSFYEYIATECDKNAVSVVNPKDKECDCPFVGAPVHTATGNMRYTEIDPLPGIPGVSFARHYDRIDGSIATSYVYDVQGNLTSVTDPNGNTTAYVYDDFGQMLSQASPVTGTTAYTYDLAGNLISTTDANGATTARTYDVLNRITASSASKSGATTEAVSWDYDDATAGHYGLGRLATMTDPSGSTTYRYERRGLLAEEAKTIDSASYTTSYRYDEDANRSSLTYPSGNVVSYTFDYADRAYSVTAGSTTIISAASYLPFGPEHSLTFGNGTTKTMTFDARYRPTENKVTTSSATLADYTYSEDGVGNITAIHDTVTPTYNRDFGYDDLNRLTSANTGTSLWGTGTYSYDAMGNMLSIGLGTAHTASFSYSGTTPKLTNVTENGVARSVAYDSAGNESSVGSASYTYSPRNELTDADALNYTYDGRGIRTTTTYPESSLETLSISPTTLYTSQSATGTVTLYAAAPTGGRVVTLSSSAFDVSVPSSITIPAGSTSGTFTITQTGATTAGSATITAMAVLSRTADVTIVAGPLISTVASSPTSVIGGSTMTGTVTLAAPAPVGGATVALSSSVAAATVPASVAIAAGASSATFTISTIAVTADASATITALYNGTSSTSVTVHASQFVSLGLTPTTVMSSGSATGLVSLDGPAAVATTVTLSSSNAAVASVPASVTIAAGASSQSFAVATTPTTSDVDVTITATVGSTSRDATLTVLVCVPGSASAPTIPSGDTVWIDDTLPAGMGTTTAWDTTQHASGTQSVHVVPASGDHYVSLLGATTTLPIAIGEHLTTYLLVSQCARPREIEIGWHTTAGQWKRAYWGESLLGSESTYLSMGAIPSGGAWQRIDIAASALGLEEQTVDGIFFDLYDGEAWIDHVSKSGTGCTAATAATPTIVTGDTAWIDDTLPAGMGTTTAWDTAQKASGTQSLHAVLQGGDHFVILNNATAPMPVGVGTHLTSYMLVNECAPPREIVMAWYSPRVGWKRAYWGESLLGFESTYTSMGSIPTGGTWTRVDVAASALGLEEQNITGFLFDLYDGEGWVDHVGMDGEGCFTAAATHPTIPGGDTVWVDDALPAGMATTTEWDSGQSASGAQSLRVTKGAGEHFIIHADATTTLSIATGAKLVSYVLLDECATPREMVLAFHSTTAGWKYAYWGETLLGGESGYLSMGSLPTAGTWTRMEIEASALGVEGTSIDGFFFDLYDGQAWLDHIGTAPTTAVLTEFSADHTSPQASGTAITWTATATGPVTPLEYRFERQDSSVWSIVQAYSTTNTYEWTPTSGDAGDHAVRVSVRNAGSLADFEDTQTLSMTITTGSGLALPRGDTPSLFATLRPSHWLGLLRTHRMPPLSLSITAPVAETTSGPGDLRRHSLYTPEMHLMAETSESTATTPPVAYEYIWFNGKPVAQIDVATSAVHYTFTDHLGTPIIQTGASGTVEWRVEYEPYGDVSAHRTESSRHQTLGFPGQEHELGVGGREYNLFRWYRNAWGRYTQSDPIGLTRKKNLYSYTFENPLGWIDPAGLAEYEPLPDCGKLPCGTCCAARHRWGQEANEHTFHYSHIVEVGITLAGAAVGASEGGTTGAIFGALVGFTATYAYLSFLQTASEAAIDREYEHCVQNCGHNSLTSCQTSPPLPPSIWQTPPTAGRS